MFSFLKNDGVRVFLGLVIGLAGIMYFNPPHTVCDSKKDVYFDSVKKQTKNFLKNLALCKEHTEMGGCLPFLSAVEKMLGYLDELGTQCKPELIKDDMTHRWIQTSMEMMVRGAWGTRAPVSAQTKNGWLELSQLSTFCKLKKSLVEIYTDDAWMTFIESMLRDLPDAQTIGRNEAWARSILSNTCKY